MLCLVELIIISVIIVCICFIFGCIMISKIYHNSNQDMNKNSSLSGGKRTARKSAVAPNVVQPVKGMIIPQSFPQVGVLTNEILYKTPLTDFVWLEKTDGQHYNLILFNDKLYAVVHGEVKEHSTLPINCAHQTILDTEFYNDKFYIFDCPMVEGKDISESSFVERMSAADSFIKSHPELQQLFVIKAFYNVDSNSFPKLLRTINTTNKSPITGNNIDGVVFQNINLPYYYDKGNIVFKLKRRVLNTIDFKLIYDEEEHVFYLYLLGTYIHVLFNKKKLPHINSKSFLHTGIELNQRELPKKLYVLFCSPYFEDLHCFTPDSNFNKSGYFEDEITTITQLSKQMEADPKSFNNKIVELSLNEDNVWVPMRVRDDKINSNGYDVGLSNVSVMFNPITESSITDSSLYFTKSKQLAFDESITTPYHEISKLIRQYIIEHSINLPLTVQQRLNNLSVLDLAGGRGADELELYHCGTYNIFAMDADKTALVQYVERTSSTPRIKNFNFLLKESREPKDLKKCIYINAIHGFLDVDNSEIESDIRSRFEFPQQVKNRQNVPIRSSGFDVILMNYAIHYLCDDLDKLRELERFVSSLLRPDGLFIFSCFDGDEIKQLISSHGGNVSKFHITLVNPSKNIAKMPLPTIDSSGYRGEPLCTKQCLDIFYKSSNLEPVESYAPLKHVRVLDQFSNITDTEHVADFLQFVRVHVFRKK